MQEQEKPTSVNLNASKEKETNKLSEGNSSVTVISSEYPGSLLLLEREHIKFVSKSWDQ